jgi:hypothetical protein
MLICMLTHSRFVENRPVGSWETNPCFFRGVLSHLALNFSVQTTSLSDGARARKLSIPDGVTSLAGERRGGVGDLAL